MTIENVATTAQDSSADMPTGEAVISILQSLLSNPLFLIGFAFALIVIVMVYYVIHSGLFSTIEVDTRNPKTGKMMVAYKTGRGSYRSGDKLFSDACSIVMKRKHIIIYYDDPQAVPEDEVRYAVGTILAEGKEEPDQEEVDSMLKHGFKLVHFPEPEVAVMSSFPFTTTLSIYLVIFRVYPKLKDYIESRGLCAYPAVEIYTSKSIDFMLPLSKQEYFFVPEFQDEIESVATTEFSNHPDHASVDDDLVDNVFARVLFYGQGYLN